MIYITEIIKGVILAFGIIIGFVIFCALLAKKLKAKDTYRPDDLIEPFIKYLEKIKAEEVYEEIKQVHFILGQLRFGILPVCLDKYIIKKDIAIQSGEDGEKSIIRFIRIYTVKRKP